MAARKRSRDCNGGQYTTKKLKMLVKSDVVWEWEGDGGVWIPYNDDLTEQISEAFISHQPKAIFTAGSSKFYVIFKDMVQRNAVTSWERRVRVRSKNNIKTEISEWQWQDENNKWRSYGRNVQELLHAARCFDVNKVCTGNAGQQYEIKIDKLEQVNTSTKTKRKIRLFGDNEDDEAPITNQPSRSTANPHNSSKNKSSVDEKPVVSTTSVKMEPDQAQNVKAISFKGKVPVDQECPSKNKYHVYIEGNDIWDAMLNQTNLKNNNNKYYLLQLLESNSSRNFAVWYRWGRVGKNGQNSLFTFGGDLENAKETFRKKFHDKTLNDWEDRASFEKVPGKYDLLSMDYSSSVDKGDEEDAAPNASIKQPVSSLDGRLQVVIEMICNVQAMEDVVMEMKYDAKKAPLGKLTKEQINAGYTALKKIEKLIKKSTFGEKLIKACDEFYTRIPHCFGMRRPPVIRTKEEILEKAELLQALGDIEIAMKVMAENDDLKLHPIDRHYQALNCKLEPLDHQTEEFGVIDKYLQNTHAPTHNHYKMKLEEVFTCKHQAQEEQFCDVGNRVLLWHGSRLTNWVGILKQGLRIAPPEAPVTGYMFGKGVYFADMSSKSANYCFATKRKNVGFLLLSEVSLGKSNELIAADYDADQLPSGYHSVKGLGKVAPDPVDNFVMPDGVTVPLGKAKDTGISNTSGYTLNYNEFVVYDTKQVRSRYLLQVKFIFN